MVLPPKPSAYSRVCSGGSRFFCIGASGSKSGYLSIPSPSPLAPRHSRSQSRRQPSPPPLPPPQVCRELAERSRLLRGCAQLVVLLAAEPCFAQPSQPRPEPKKYRLGHRKRTSPRPRSARHSRIRTRANPRSSPGPAIGEEHYELGAAAKQRESPARSGASRSGSGYWAGRLPKRVPRYGGRG